MSAAAAKDPIVITHAISGARCTIYPHGAHLTSYVDSSGREVLFLSRDAALDGSRAIRGGVPLCFPQFGRHDESMPQHGFLRNNFWREVPGSRIDDDDGGSRVSLELSLADAIRARGKTGDWGSEETEYDASFTYTVSINGSGFETTIVMENRGTTPWKKFQVLLHNYFSVRDGKALDGEACNVSGLGGYAFHDKVTGEKSVLPPLLGPDDRPPLVTVPAESVIDREYAPPPGRSTST